MAAKEIGIAIVVIVIAIGVYSIINTDIDIPPNVDFDPIPKLAENSIYEGFTRI